MRLEHSLVIERPPAEVFAFLANVAKLPLWQDGITEIRPSEEATGVGSRHVEVRSLMGMRIEQTLEVTAFDPPERLDYAVVQGPLELQVSHHLTRIDTGTRLDVVGEGDPGPLFRLASPLVAAAVRAQSRSDFARLKQLLESE